MSPLAGLLPQAPFFCPKIMFLWEKNNFPRLAACRRRLFLSQKWHFWPKPFSSGWPIAAGALFLVQNDIHWEKDNFSRLAACRRRFFLWPKMTFSRKKIIFIGWRLCGHGCFAAMAASRPWPLRGRGRLLVSVVFSKTFGGKIAPENDTLYSRIFFYYEKTLFLGKKKSDCGKPPAGGKLCFSIKNVFKKMKCHFPGLFFHQKFFLKTTKKWRRPPPRSGHGREAAMAAKRPHPIPIFSNIFGLYDLIF